MSRFNGLLLVALRHLGRVLDDLLGFNGILVEIHGGNYFMLLPDDISKTAYLICNPAILS